MTDINPYEQGFRDALLTARAALMATPEDYATGLDALIDQKNHDLWKVLALAQVDLSAHPEAQALRAMLRAPNGVLLDGRGRMLFLRINGVEYDTGVLGLLEERAKREAARELPEEPPAPEMMSIRVNGRERRVLRYQALTYEKILAMEGWTLGATVTYRGKGDAGEFAGTLTAGGSLVAPPGTIFNVTLTGSS